MAKLKNQITININDEDAAIVEAIAELYQRKPAELVRLLLVPTLRAEWLKLQNELHPENTKPATLAHCPTLPSLPNY